MLSETWSPFTDADAFPPSSRERQNVAAAKTRDDLADICDSVTAQIRDAYLSGGRSLGDDGTIPDALRARAIAIATWRFVTEGLPQNEALQTPSRRDAFNEAVNYLHQIATRQIPTAGSVHIPHRSPRQATRHRLDGLV